MRKIQTLVMLLAAYLCATWLPGPGLWLRSVEFGSLTLPLPQVLLAGLLFTAGLCSTPDALRTILRLRRPFLLMALSAWLLPLLSAAVGAAVLWSLGCPPSVLLGMLVVAAMPVANSSVGWSTSMGGSVPLSIALLVVGTALSPLLSPMVINAGAVTMGTAEQALRETPWSEGMGQFFLLWVLLPVLFGAFLASRFRPTVREHLLPVAKRVSFLLLIALNYLNGAACLPELAQRPLLLLWPMLGAGSMLSLTYACYFAFQRCSLLRGTEAEHGRAEHGRAEQRSLLLAVIMRNTGAALVFAGAALPDFALVSITIITYTLFQHLWVAFFLAKRGKLTSPARDPSPLGQCLVS